MKKTPLSYIVLVLQFAAVLFAYYYSAHWGLSLNAVNTFAAPIWPPAGIALVAIFFGGYRFAIPIAIAAFTVNFMTGAPAAGAFGIALGNTLEAIVGAYLLQSFKFNPLFNRLSDGAVFIAVALSVPFMSAIIGPLALGISGALSREALLVTSLTWWAGDVIGVLVVAPFLLKWFARPFRLEDRSVADLVEIAAFITALVTISIFVFWEPIEAFKEISFPYLVFVPLTWCALRLGPRFLTLGIVTVSVLAVIGTLMGVGPFAMSTMFLLQIFLSLMSSVFLLFVSAVEERKHVAQELRKNVIDLTKDVAIISEADRAKNEFIAILSHELRNPLAPVLSSLELLRLKTGKFPEFKETFDLMHEQISRITRLLDDLLDITRISRKKFNLQIERVKLQDVLTHSIATARQSIEKRGHALVEDIPTDPIWIDADPLRLEQVFVNLLNNAAKYTETGGRISISARRAQNGAEVRVRDNGIGLPPDMLVAIFEPFRQVKPGEAGSTGLGIGLSLSKRFVELHSGTIEARSGGLGSGSEIIVWLPTVVNMLLAAGRAETGTGTPVPQSAHEPRKKRLVLIVDDHKDTAHGIAKLLNFTGHEARTAYDSESAFKALGEFRPDIIFLDIGLPGESGYELMQKIRSYMDSSPVIVALTGYGQEEDKQRALESGFDQHLTKPVSIADLEKVLQQM